MRKSDAKEIRNERMRMLNILRSVRDRPDHPLADDTRAWALGCLSMLDQVEAGADRSRLRQIAQNLDDNEARLIAAYRDEA